MKKKRNSLRIREIAIKCIILILLISTVIGIVNATFTNTPAKKVCPPQPVNVHFVAGSDSQSHPVTFPAATVNVASSHTTASVAFSLFPSTTRTPQPSTYYTDLLRIQNYGSACTINSVTLSNIAGARNLGNLTIYLYATQTDSPQTGIPIAYTSLTSASSGTISLLTNAYTLGPLATVYIEVAGYAASTASNGATVSFRLNMQIASAQSATITIAGGGSLLLKHSAGTINGITGSQAPFKFNIRSVDDKVCGDLSVRIYHMDKRGFIHIYQVTSNIPLTLNMEKTATQTSAKFDMTATIVDITSPWHQVIVTDKALLKVALTEYINKPDTIAFTLTQQSGKLFYSSNWNGASSVEQALWTGTLSIVP